MSNLLFIKEIVKLSVPETYLVNLLIGLPNMLRSAKRVRGWAAFEGDGA